MLVCRLIMSLAERLFPKFHNCPGSEYSFFGPSLSRGHYQPTYQPPKGIYLLNNEYRKFAFFTTSCTFFCGELSKREINAVKKKYFKKYFKEVQVITMMCWIKNGYQATAKQMYRLLVKENLKTRKMKARKWFTLEILHVVGWSWRRLSKWKDSQPIQESSAKCYP